MLLQALRPQRDRYEKAPRWCRSSETGEAGSVHSAQRARSGDATIARGSAPRLVDLAHALANSERIQLPLLRITGKLRMHQHYRRDIHCPGAGGLALVRWRR